MTKANPVVFISYAHEGDLSEKVRFLSEWLISKGVTSLTDHPYINRPPKEGWSAWMQHSIEDADLVLIVCTQRYKQLFERRNTPDGKGHGVTWESAIITDTLYQTKLNNVRFFPILTEGESYENIPIILRNWNNNYRFPSGNNRILSLICDEISIPRPDRPMQLLRPGELTSEYDPRLEPHQGKVIGRESELGKILAFLVGNQNSAAVSSNVTGSGGIGKTEVCKKALKRWLSTGGASRVFWVSVTDTADARRLIAHLGEAIGLNAQEIAKIDDFRQLREMLPSGLYYLDNLEHVAESTAGIQLLSALITVPGVRILASTRVALDGILGESIPVDRLDSDSACHLFLNGWIGDTPDSNHLYKFVDEQLGGHPLSIILLARLGRVYSWHNLQDHWIKQGIKLAKKRHATGRMDSLEISFSITASVLAEEPGALDLWQFLALFPEGVNEEVIDNWGRISGLLRPRIVLAEHHVLNLHDNKITMLPPIARYALSHVDKGSAQLFDWTSARSYAYRYFIALSSEASNTISTDSAITARVKSSEQLWGVSQLFTRDMDLGIKNNGLLHRLHQQLKNVYLFNALAGRTALNRTKEVLDDALSSNLLGDLESRLGNVDQARKHYDEAIRLYQKERDELGLANVYQSQGDMLLADSRVENALCYYLKALPIYQLEKDPVGHSYTVSEIIRCNYLLGDLDTHNLNKLAITALTQAEKSGVESVKKYVFQALKEACDDDVSRLKELVKSLGRKD